MPPSNVNFSKSMPQKFRNSDGGNSFILGRRAFFNNTSDSYSVKNVSKNIDYSDVLGKKSSIIYGKPLEDNSSELRIQRLRLSAVGSGSSRLKNADDKISFKSTDLNLVNNALSRVRGSGATGPKYRKKS